MITRIPTVRLLSAGLMFLAMGLGCAATSTPVAIVPLRLAADNQTPVAGPIDCSPLADYDFGGKREAVQKLTEQLLAATPARRVEAESALIALLGRADLKPGAVDAACRLLISVGSDAAVPALAARVDTPASCVALQALGAIPGAKAEAALIAAIATTQGAIRLAVINAVTCRPLAAEAKATASKALASLAVHKDPATAQAAWMALGSIGTAEAQAALAAVPAPGDAGQVRELELARLAGWRNQAAAGALPAGVLTAIEALATGKGQAAVRQPALLLRASQTGGDAWVLRLLADADPAISVTAAQLATNRHRVLGDAVGERTITAAGAALATLSPPVQTVLLNGLALTPTAASRTLLATVVTGALPGELRLIAITSLGYAGNADAAAPLAAQLEDAKLANGAVDALARLPGAGVDQMLLGRMNGATPAIKARLLTVLGLRNHHPAFAAAMAETASTDGGLRDTAFQTVGLLATAKEMPVLLDLLVTAKSDREVRALGKALTQALRGGADPDVAAGLLLERIGKAHTEDIRQQMYALLSLLDCPKAHQTLADVLATPDPELRKELLRVLGKARQGHTVPILMKAAKAAQDPVELVLAIRAGLDALPDDNTRSKEARIPDYERLWNLAQREEERSAVVAALQKLGTDRKLQETAKRLTELATAKPLGR